MRRFFDLKTSQQTREKNGEGDLVVSTAFSSEEPVERWWGVEILDHGDGSVMLDRLNDGAPVLFNHNPHDLRGTHEPGTVKVSKDRVLRGEIRLTSATQIGRETIGMVEGKVLTKASIGYRVLKVVEQATKRKGKKSEPISREIDGDIYERMVERFEQRGDGRRSARADFIRELDREVGQLERDDDEPVFRIMSWLPLENSLVTIPADNSVGVGRSEENYWRTSRQGETADNATTRKGNTMPKKAEELAAEAEAAEREQREKAEREAAEKIEAAQRKVGSMSAVELEKARTRAIENIVRANNLGDALREHWITTGATLEHVTDDVLKILEKRGQERPQSKAKLGLSEGEAKRFSLNRAIYACAEKNWANAGFELECSRAIAEKLNQVPNPNRFYVPFEVMERPVMLTEERMREIMMKRDLNVATAGAGGFLVSTDNMGFIEILRNRSVAFMMGVRRLSGLQGNVTVPRQSAAATAFWLANETTQLTESQQTFVQLALTPKTVGAYTEVSRLLTMQSSPAAEGIVTDDLAQVTALAADLAVFEGSGAGGQPTGVANTAGIGSVSGTTLGYAGILEFQTDVAEANVRPIRGGYVTTPAVAALLMQRARFANTDTPVWDGNVWDGRVSGFPGASTNQLTAATMMFGDWQEVVVGEWGVLEVEVNPFANFQAGIIGVRAMYSLDVGVRRPFAFSRATTIT